MSTDVGSYTKCPAVEHGAPIVPNDEAQPLHDEQAELSTSDVATRASWKPAYLTLLGFLAVIFALFGVSTSIDMFYVDVRPVTHIATTAFAPVCDGGCAAADRIVADDLFKQSEEEPCEFVNAEIIPQMRPFAVTLCVEWSAGIYEVKARSRTSKTRGTFQVNCAAPSIAPQYTNFTYVKGFNFFHALGAPKIYRMDYLTKARAVPMTTLLMVISGFSLVLHVAAMALRATSSEARRCSGPTHIRRLIIAVLFSLLLGFVVTFAHMSMSCVPNEPSVCGEGCVEGTKATDGYISTFISILFLQVLAVIPACVCYHQIV